MSTEGYKGHRAGSAKGKVHKAFDEKGKDAAIALAARLEKAESTARTWVSEWSNGTAKKSSKKATSKASKANARKPVKPAGKKKAAKKATKRERLAA